MVDYVVWFGGCVGDSLYCCFVVGCVGLCVTVWVCILIVLLFANDYFLLVYVCILGWCV